METKTTVELKTTIRPDPKATVGMMMKTMTMTMTMTKTIKTMTRTMNKVTERARNLLQRQQGRDLLQGQTRQHRLPPLAKAPIDPFWFPK